MATQLPKVLELTGVAGEMLVAGPAQMLRGCSSMHSGSQHRR